MMSFAQRISQLSFLIQKEFKLFFRNKFFPKMIVGFPVIAILVIPWVANMEIKNVRVGILDFDKSAFSRELAQKIEASLYFKAYDEILLSRASANACINANLCDIIIEIPSHFESRFYSDKSAPLALYANAINSTKGTLGTGYLSSIIAEFGVQKSAALAGFGANLALSLGANSAPNSTFSVGEISASNSVSNSTLSLSANSVANLGTNSASNSAFNVGANSAQSPQILSVFAFNPHLDYKLYMIPALMVMVLTLLCGFLPAFNIIAEKQSGNIEQINVSPLPKALFILSKIIPYWIMGLFVLSLCFALAFLVYGFASKGGYASIYAFALVYILVVTGLGLVISNYSATLQQAMFVSYFFILILLLLSGLFTSVKSMPFWAQLLTYANPLRYFIEALRGIFLRGENLVNSADLVLNLAVLFAFALVFNAWAIKSYKKRL